MKPLLIVCSGLLLLGVTNMPIGYYTLLRIIVTIGAIIIVFSEIENGINIWVILFGLTGILFNPLLPIYLNKKEVWIPVDMICAILFLIKAFINKTNLEDK